MDKKLIVLDLDGTTLKEDQTISARTKSALTRAREKGHEVMIATGRPFRLSSQYYRELELKSPIVNFNGAILHHPLDASYTGSYHQAIDLAIVHELLDYTKQFSLSNIAAEVEDSVFLARGDDSVPANFKTGTGEVYIGNLRTQITANPTSVLFFGQTEQLNTISRHLDDALSHVISYHTWGASWPAVEVVKHGIHKAIGVDKAAKTLGFETKNVIAFGDEANDLEMLDYAGVGVAMGNAVDAAKNAANTVTKSNEEDGIAIYLEENLL
ncbi:Cof-type HAD-IIB family hydrolase [Listeria aquatica]|nr:Cof-type HAD-IIB family hydrolase [Listeria aquatica]